MMKDLLYLGIWNYWRCMYNITVEMLLLRGEWNGVNPVPDIERYVLDPKTIGIELYYNPLPVHYIQASDYSVVISGRVLSWTDDAPLRKVGDKITFYSSKYMEPMPYEYIHQLANGFGTHKSGFKAVHFPYRVKLFINWREYEFEYMKEHIMDMKVLFDQIRTDTLLEEIDG